MSNEALCFLESLLHEEPALRALTGLTVDDANGLFAKYCGPSTPIRTMSPVYCDVAVYKFCSFCRGELLELFWYLRQYPTRRAIRLLHRSRRDTTEVLKRIKRRIAFLAATMTDVAEAAARRFEPDNALPHVFPPHVTASVDTFPVRIARPESSALRKISYSGKHKTWALKVFELCA